jgi:hypothetical protein
VGVRKEEGRERADKEGVGIRRIRWLLRRECRGYKLRID